MHEDIHTCKDVYSHLHRLSDHGSYRSIPSKATNAPVSSRSPSLITNTEIVCDLNDAVQNAWYIYNHIFFSFFWTKLNCRLQPKIKCTKAKQEKWRWVAMRYMRNGLWWYRKMIRVFGGGDDNSVKRLACVEDRVVVVRW